MNIDFKKFHKLETNDSYTTLAHPNGHQIKIAHKGLSAQLRKELDGLPMKMAKGGKVSYQEFTKRMEASKASGPSKPSSGTGAAVPEAAYTPPAQAKNAYTEPDESGTDPYKDVVIQALHRQLPPFGPLKAEKPHYPPCINPSCKSFGKPHPNCRCYGGVQPKSAGAGQEMMFAKGGDVEHFCSEDRPHEEGCEYFKAGGLAEGEGPDETPPAMEVPKAEIPAVPEKPEEAPAPETPDTEVAAAPEQQQINPNPEQPQKVPEAAQTPIQDFSNHKQKVTQELFPEAQAFKADLDNGHIQPQTYHDLFAKKDTLGKIGTLFGLLLGGAGSGLTGQPNVVLEMMNKQIDNDLHAQQESVTNKQNFLRINQDNIMKQSQAKALDQETKAKAWALTKTQMNYAALHDLVTNVNKMPPGPQKDQAMQTLAMMNQGIQNENFNILDRAAAGAAFYKTLFGTPEAQAAPGTPQAEQSFQQQVKARKALGPQGEKIAEDMEAKHYPGIPGQASMPLNADDRNQIHTGIAFDRAVKTFRDWASKHSGDLNFKDKAYGHALAADVQGAYRQATKGGVYKEGEQNFISGIIDENPTKFFNEIRVLPKLDATINQNQLRLDQILKDKGFAGFPGAKGAVSESPIERLDQKTGKVVLYDSKTKKALGYK